MLSKTISSLRDSIPSIPGPPPDPGIPAVGTGFSSHLSPPILAHRLCPYPATPSQFPPDRHADLGSSANAAVCSSWLFSKQHCHYAAATLEVSAGGHYFSAGSLGPKERVCNCYKHDSAVRLRRNTSWLKRCMRGVPTAESTRVSTSRAQD